jgi:hypothetical protein
VPTPPTTRHPSTARHSGRQRRPARSPRESDSDACVAGRAFWAIEFVSLRKTRLVSDQRAQAVFAVFKLNARNLNREASTLYRRDFEVTEPGGARFPPTENPLVFFSTGQIQPGLSKEFLVVFDLNPGLSGYVLHAATIPFRFDLPAGFGELAQVLPKQAPALATPGGVPCKQRPSRRSDREGRATWSWLPWTPVLNLR